MEDNAGPQRFYHGTRAVLRRGDLVEPGHRKNWPGRSVDGLVYFTDSVKNARIWGGGPGREAAEKHFGVREAQRQDPVNVYVVKPTGEYEPDANFPARIDYGRIFDPGEADNEVLSWQSRHNLRVVTQHQWSQPGGRSAQPVHEQISDLSRWSPDSPAYGWCHACKVSHGDPSTYSEHEQVMDPQLHSLAPWDFEGVRLPDGATFYHGTWHEFGPGDVLKPGQPGNFCAEPGDFVYFTSHRGMGYTWAEDVIRARGDALGEDITGLVPRVYEVKPTAPFTLDDANADNYDSAYQDYRTTGQLVVVRELPREYAPATIPEHLRLRRAVVPLTVVLANDADMCEVLASGRVSETPDAPVWLNARPDMPGLWELANGHHRVADLLRRGVSEVDAELDPCEDDEPLEGPFFDFAAALRSNRYAVADRPGGNTADPGDLPVAQIGPLPSLAGLEFPARAVVPQASPDRRPRRSPRPAPRPTRKAPP